jgi:hypothetical protein
MANALNKYQNGKIYKLKCINPDISEEEYVGHTTQRYLSSRLVQHRDGAKNVRMNKRKVYEAMNSTGVHNWQILLLEDYPCTSSDQIKAREQYWIDLLHPTLNMIGAVLDVPGGKENKNRYYRENKDKLLAYCKEHQSQPYVIEQIKKRCASIIHCQCGQQSTKYNYKRHKRTQRHATRLENQFNNEFQMLANIDIY